MPRTALLPLAAACIALAACSPAAQPEAGASETASESASAAASTPAPAASAQDSAAPAGAASPSTALAVGAAAPDFNAQAWLAGKEFDYKLAEARAKGPVVLYFFPAAYTPGCNIEAHQFSQAIDKFTAAGASVIGVTAGNADQLAKFSADNERCAGKFPVAADPGAKIAAQYGVVMAKKPELSNRTSFVIDRGGRIAAVHSDLSPEGHVDAMLAGLKAP